MAKKELTPDFLYENVSRTVDETTKRADYTYEDLKRAIVRALTEQA